jgi:hypothetical protein
VAFLLAGKAKSFFQIMFFFIIFSFLVLVGGLAGVFDQERPLMAYFSIVLFDGLVCI